MARSKHKLTAHWARLIFDLLQREGLDAPSLFERSGITTLSDPTSYVEQDRISALWTLAREESGDAAIGLKMGMNPSINAFDVYSSSIISSRCVRDALSRAERYQKIVGSALTLTLEDSSEGLLVVFAGRGDDMPVAREGYDAALVLMAATLRSITSTPIVPRYVEFAYPEPADLTAYKTAFASPLRFGGKQYQLCIDSSVLDLPLLFASESMNHHHEQRLDDAIKQLDDAPLSNRVSQFIARQLPAGEPSVLQVAQAFHSSPRSLQRHLRQEGVSLRALLDEVRKTLALEYAKDPKIPLQEITFLLGFADHSNFYRAFRRWYDCAPGAMRRGKTVLPS